VTFCILSVPPACGPTVSWFIDVRGRPWLPLVLLSLEELAQGMADDRIAAGLEAQTGLEGIEIAVELLA
jgi:hypothetical protein